MEDNKFKKLALMGLTGGLLFLGAEANATSLNGSYGSILAAGCGASIPQGQQISTGCAGRSDMRSDGSPTQSCAQGGERGSGRGQQISTGCAGRSDMRSDGSPNQSEGQRGSGSGQFISQSCSGGGMRSDGSPTQSCAQGGERGSGKGQQISQGCGGKSEGFNNPATAQSCGASKEFRDSSFNNQSTAQSCGASKPTQNNEDRFYYADAPANNPYNDVNPKSLLKVTKTNLWLKMRL